MPQPTNNDRVNKSKPLRIALIISSIVSALLFLQVAYLVVGDIAAGALSGTPETGWGFVFVFFFFGPIFIVSLVVTLILRSKYSKSGQSMPNSSNQNIQVANGTTTVTQQAPVTMAAQPTNQQPTPNPDNKEST